MGELTHTVGGDSNLVSFRSAARVPITSLKVHFSPVQEGTGDPSPENVRPISGWTGFEVYKAGKNLFGGEALKAALITTMPVNSVDESTVVYSNNDAPAHDGEVLYSQFKPNTQYTLIFTASKNTNNYIHLKVVYTDNSIDLLNGFSPIDTKVTKTFVTSANKSVKAVCRAADEYSIVTMYYNECGIFEGVQDATAYEPYQGQTLPIDWSSAAGTVYGGYADLVTGEVWETYHHIAITAADITKRRGYGQHESSQTTQVSWFTQNAFNAPNPTPYVAGSTDGFCSHLPFLVNNYAFYPKCQANNTTVDLRISGLLTIEEFTTWLEDNGPIDVVYPVATPFVVTTLTPTALKTLLNHNNIWSNANGPTEVSYAIHDSAMIRAAKRRIANFDATKKMNVPPNYREVEWIGITQGQQVPYIDMGFVLSDELETEVHFYNDKSEAFLFGARKLINYSPYCNFNICKSPEAFRFDYGDTRGDGSVFTGMHTGEYLASFHNRSLTIENCETHATLTKDYSGVTFQSYNRSLLLFAVLTGNDISQNDATGNFYIYSAKFWIGGELVRDFVPCVRKSDNIAGMYDKVTKQFFTSANSNTFSIPT